MKSINEGIFQSSPVQQMMAAGSNNWLSTNGSSHHSLLAAPPQNHHLPPPLTAPLSWPASQELPHSWSQLVLGFAGEEDKGGISHKNMEIWEQQILNNSSVGGGKQENSAASYSYGGANLEFMAAKSTNCLSPPPVVSSSPPKSCVTTSSMCNYSNKSSEIFLKSNSKKPKIHPTTSAQSGIKNAYSLAWSKHIVPHRKGYVRKEKLGDRITALHQIVSPFGKTDTASVLLEAIGYIRFLQRQIEALSLPYLGSGSGNITHQHHAPGAPAPPPVQRERTSLFPEDPGQLLNEMQTKKRKAISEEECEEEEEVKKDLKSRGLCLVPLSCTIDFGSDNGADYWAPSFGGNF